MSQNGNDRSEREDFTGFFAAMYQQSHEEEADQSSAMIEGNYLINYRSINFHLKIHNISKIPENYPWTSLRWTGKLWQNLKLSSVSAKISRAYSKLTRFLDTLIFENFRAMLIQNLQ